MDVRPILTTLRRHKTASALIVLEIALSCAIICNALFLISGRIDRMNRVSGLAEDQLVRDSRSASGRWRCGIGFTPSRLQTSPPTRPRHDPLVASTAIIACTSTPYTFPLSDRAEGRDGAVPWSGTHLTSVLDRQDVPPGTCRAGQIGPARNQLCCRHRRFRARYAHL